jgi:hypothetical protein
MSQRDRPPSTLRIWLRIIKPYNKVLGWLRRLAGTITSSISLGSHPDNGRKEMCDQSKAPSEAL